MLLGWGADKGEVGAYIRCKENRTGASETSGQQRQDKTRAAGQDFIQRYGVLAERAVILFRAKNTVRVSRFQQGSNQQYRHQGNKPGAIALGGMAD